MLFKTLLILFKFYNFFLTILMYHLNTLECCLYFNFDGMKKSGFFLHNTEYKEFEILYSGIWKFNM